MLTTLSLTILVYCLTLWLHVTPNCALRLTAHLGSRDVINHVTIWYPYVIFYWWSFGTVSLSPAVFEILRSKRIGVTSLTFHGHVTSSVTDHSIAHNAFSYCWCFGIKPLSLTVSEIFSVKCNAMADVTLIQPLNKGQGHSFWYQSISHIRLPIRCQ